MLPRIFWTSARSRSPSSGMGHLRDVEYRRFEHNALHRAVVDRAADGFIILFGEALRELKLDVHLRQLFAVADRIERQAEALGREAALLTETEGVEAHAARH